MAENGFAFLDIHSNGSFSSAIQSYAAGYLEGVVSSTRIRQYYINFGTREYKSNEAVLAFVKENYNWTLSQV